VRGRAPGRSRTWVPRRKLQPPLAQGRVDCWRRSQRIGVAKALSSGRDYKLTQAADAPWKGTRLQAYLLGEVPFERALEWQRRLGGEVAAGGAPAVLLCEHARLITVGRHGSRGHIFMEEDEIAARGWDLCWVGRGGGAWLHSPGQLVVDLLVPLEPTRPALGLVLELVREVLLATAEHLGIRCERDRPGFDVWAGNRPLACVGLGVRNWVTCHGAILNINPDLFMYRKVRCGANCPTMTSLERQRHGPVRPSQARQVFLEHLVRMFGFADMAVYSDHPIFTRKASSYAETTAHPRV